MIGIPCFVLREKTARSYQHARGNDGAERGRREKRLIACTMIEYAAAATGEKMASIGGCVWWMGNISDAFAGVPCLTPLCRTLLHIDFRTITCLRYHYPPSR